MNRTRRVALTVAAATGILAGAAATVVTVGHVGAAGPATTTGTSSALAVQAADPAAQAADQQRQALTDYVADMHAARTALDERVVATRQQLTKAKARHERRVARAKARVAAQARAAAVAAAQQRPEPARVSHTLPVSRTSVPVSHPRSASDSRDDHHEHDDHEHGDD
ncbi:MAG: hypothetical protein QOI54_2596 [Actinomycetota bacterium]|jgi:hypothetical protein|nr:hypothetical protein [Actinomycetota bacterium]